MDKIETWYETRFEEFWEEYRKTQSINVDDFKAVLYVAFLAGYDSAKH